MYMLSSGDVYWLVKYFYDNVLSLHKISDLTSASGNKIMNFDMAELIGREIVAPAEKGIDF